MEKATMQIKPNIYFFYDILTADAFKRASVWCEYQYPDELDELTGWGLEENLLEERVINKLDDHEYIYYSIPDAFWGIIKRDFIYVKATLEHGFNKHAGYFSVVNGDITAVRLFTDNGSTDLYLNPEFAEDNIFASEALRIDVAGLDSLRFKYILSSEAVCNHSVKGEIDFPVH